MISKHSFFDPDMPYLAIREAIPIKIIFIRKKHKLGNESIQIQTHDRQCPKHARSHPVGTF